MLSTIFWVFSKGIMLLIGSAVEIPIIIRAVVLSVTFLGSEVAWHGPREAIPGLIQKAVLTAIALIVSTLLGGGWNYEIFEKILVGIFICSDMEGLKEFWEYRNSQDS